MTTATIDPGDPEPLMDEPVGLRVEGLSPGRAVAVSARWLVGGVPVSSLGTYVADDDGVVAPGAQPSLGGTYAGSDPYGLWWSARPESGEVPLSPSVDAVTVTILVVDGDDRLATAVLRRRWAGPGVEATELGDGGVVGTAFRPPGPGPFPAALVLGGSTGGLGGAAAKAALLASRGVATLAVAYFAAPGRPPNLMDIPVEHLGDCLAWLGARRYADADRLGVVGSSRGAELALLVGATYGRVRRVVAASPSSVLWGAAGPGAGPEAVAWTLEGRALPTARRWQAAVATRAYAEDPVRLAPVFDDALDDVASAAAAEIPVERICGPVLLISGGADAMWPSGRMAEALLRRAAAGGARDQVRHLHHPGAGHLCAAAPGTPVPVVVTHPLDGRRYLMGGSPAANAAAALCSWEHTLRLLRSGSEEVAA